MKCHNCAAPMDDLLNATHHVAWWCPRCGSLRSEYQSHTTLHAPELLGCCREFADTVGLPPDVAQAWLDLGIPECIQPPEGSEAPRPGADSRMP